MVTNAAQHFAHSGSLAAALSHFEKREGQIELAAAIEQAIKQKNHLLAEAGTGIGKTFAYLIPALLAEKKCLISTATKHLQDQVFFKDLPVVEKLLNRKIAVCLLKGRNNYLCPYRFEQTAQTATALNKKQYQQLQTIREWSEKTTSGDLSEIVTFAADDIGLRSRITSTVDNCLGSECPKYDRCFVQKVREKAKKSDLVIANHALLMADAVLKETGFAEILPEIDIVVIDEAHHLNKIATEAFAEKITSAQLNELLKDLNAAYNQSTKTQDTFTQAINKLDNALQALTDALCTTDNTGQMLLGQLKQSSASYAAFKTLMQDFKALMDEVQTLSTKHEALQPLFERMQLIAHRIKIVFANGKQTDRKQTERNQTDHSQTDHSQTDHNQATNDTDQSPSVSLLEWFQHGFSASKMPIHLGNRFHQMMQNYADSWIFVSATLSVNETFDYYQNALGLPRDIATLTVHSPFDYENHAVLHIFDDLPEPRQAQYTSAFVTAALPIITALKGRTFMLFTSYRALHEAAALFQTSDFNVFVQGDQPKTQLIDAFIHSDNAVLLGTISFWEGVDIQGAALSCVMLDKIPFPSPADPFVQEQANYIKNQGGNAFEQCYIPRAATLLKQGAGRLIRSQQDKGVLIIGDRRLVTQSYGKRLRESLPPIKVVDQAALYQFISEKLH
ncbi:ATP-dependent DNA helicase [Ostreibacterium oceani]|uniref:DNA 5'-3' helicase n=1 Tax=Ostreibacterium oceani TaxID=2654998 RepID=A0A6N7ERG6_9GAMM|nr:ATP-dependent DNA helicase [Ostreibacterium oceani]MPV85464.1 DEAD/DEAH box helicase [Ostreibacterium oceani]